MAAGAGRWSRRAGPRVRGMQRTASRKGPGPEVSGPSLPSGVGVGAARWAADPRLTAGPAARPLPGPPAPRLGTAFPPGRRGPSSGPGCPAALWVRSRGHAQGRADQYSGCVPSPWRMPCREEEAGASGLVFFPAGRAQVACSNSNGLPLHRGGGGCHGEPETAELSPHLLAL